MIISPFQYDWCRLVPDHELTISQNSDESRMLHDWKSMTGDLDTKTSHVQPELTLTDDGPYQEHREANIMWPDFFAVGVEVAAFSPYH